MKIKSQNISIHFAKLVIWFVIDIIYFPVWWYSSGLWRLVRGLFYFLKSQERAMAIRIWIKNIFVPMYGMHDIGSFFISFFMRVFQIVIRSLALVVLVFISIIILFIWILLPIAVEYAIYLQFFPT